jgi:putative membrane protein
MKKYIFTEEEKERVKLAVESLEKESCGEIVPFFARKSDHYHEVSAYLSLILSSSAFVILALLSYLWMLAGLSLFEMTIIPLAFALIGYMVPILFPGIKRLLISKDHALEMVSLRAKEAFLNEKVFQTQERIGILIFISRLEHLVIVLGDEAINKKLAPADWEQVVSLITDGLKKNEIGNGLVNSINHCKGLLLKHGFVRKSTDTDELSNELRITD